MVEITTSVTEKIKEMATIEGLTNIAKLGVGAIAGEALALTVNGFLKQSGWIAVLVKAVTKGALSGVLAYATEDTYWTIGPLATIPVDVLATYYGVSTMPVADKIAAQFGLVAATKTFSAPAPAPAPAVPAQKQIVPPRISSF
jgi:hypothetical protein